MKKHIKNGRAVKQFLVRGNGFGGNGFGGIGRQEIVKHNASLFEMLRLRYCSPKIVAYLRKTAYS